MSWGPPRLLLRFIAICTAVGFVPCWLSPGGMTRYVMPLYPGLALLIGLVSDRAAEWSPRMRTGWAVGLRVATIVMLAAPLVVLLIRFLPLPVVQAYAPSLPLHLVVSLVTCGIAE